MTTPVRQMIDHSKLVPLLTKTIQELKPESQHWRVNLVPKY